jgi:hypothetical protein
VPVTFGPGTRLVRRRHPTGWTGTVWMERLDDETQTGWAQTDWRGPTGRSPPSSIPGVASSWPRRDASPPRPYLGVPLKQLSVYG